MKKALLQIFLPMLLLLTVGCTSEKASTENAPPDTSSEPTSEEIQSIDEQFLDALASGLTARWEADRSQTFDSNTTGVEEIANRKNCIETE
ncbi:hypothetical protein JQM68_10615 [Oscillibacter valericigenes]|uniref:hypothetical protein n=1 Tax=Oscillibacter valericigenes TaxID=351091 RepID=UPI001F2B0EF9|nr:hypothetical protein [Oscillibacter valericigenes]MCF2617646.1 hypothetical protein [Oscillibacter valericigenes]